LRVRIARGRSYPSVLVIPRRKMRLCEDLHGRRTWPELELPWAGHGELAGEGRGRGRGERRGGHRCGALWGGRGVMGRGARLASYGLPVAAARSLLVVRAVVCAVREGEEEKEEREKKRKGRKRKEKSKKYGKISKLENFWGEK
jgi:hypothetical protein